jgi:hypothetical protein
VFVVSQVNEEGSVIKDAFVNAVCNLYTEDSLKSLAQSKAPDSVDKANAFAKGKYKVQTI